MNSVSKSCLFYYQNKLLKNGALKIGQRVKALQPFGSIISQYSAKTPIDDEKNETELKKLDHTSSTVSETEENIIQPTEYYNPTFSESDNFEDKFWDAYLRRAKEQRDKMDPYPDRIRYNKVYDNPVERTIGILKDDILDFFGKLKRNPLVAIRKSSDIPRLNRPQIFPSVCDVVIIGGGIVGTSIAFHLQERAHEGLKVVVVEKDMSYSKASSVLSMGGFHHQFCTPENVLLSKYGMDFLQLADRRLAIHGEDPPHIDITFNGYLTLAGEEGYPQLLQNYEMQKSHNCFVEMLTKEKLKARFPFLKMDGIEAGIHGVQREGWFNPWNLLLVMNRKCKELGTEFVNGTVKGSSIEVSGDFVFNEDTPTSIKRIRSVDVTLPDGEVRSIKCAICVIAAGAWSKDVGMLFGIGRAPSGINSIPIPVEPRKRYVYCVNSPNGPGLKCPFVIDPSGAYFRREGLGDLYLCGGSPDPDNEPAINDLSVDHKFFEEKVWPNIANRCPSFESLKMHNSWAGYYDYNTFDQNAIIGHHPLYANLLMATGFGGHGMQQAAGAGRAISDLILDAELKALPIERLGYERIATFTPLLEKCSY